MTLSRRNLLKTVGLGTLATLPYVQANAACFDIDYVVVIVGGGRCGSCSSMQSR